MQVPPASPRPPQMMPPPTPPKSNALRNILLGCGCLVLLSVLLFVGAMWYLATHAKGMLADLAAGALTNAIKESKLPEDQKARLTARIGQLQQDVKSDKISMEQLGKIAEQLVDSPLLPAASVYFLDEHYLKPSGLDEEEKERGRRATQRITRGVIEKSISENDLQKILDPISEPDPNNPGKTKLKDKVTDEELREFIKRAEDAADAKSIEDEEYQVNIADEFDKAIDKALEDSKK